MKISTWESKFVGYCYAVNFENDFFGYCLIPKSFNPKDTRILLSLPLLLRTTPYYKLWELLGYKKVTNKDC